MGWVNIFLAQNESVSTRICGPNLVAVRRSCRKKGGVQTDRHTKKTAALYSRLAGYPASLGGREGGEGGGGEGWGGRGGGREGGREGKGGREGDGGREGEGRDGGEGGKGGKGGRGGWEARE